MRTRLLASESVSEWHPDQIADQISDAILDAFLREDPGAHSSDERGRSAGTLHFRFALNYIPIKEMMAACGVVVTCAPIRAWRRKFCADTAEPMRSIYQRSDDIYQGEGCMQAIIRVFFVLTFAAAGAAFAQGYPARPIKLVVPWPPGQATDLYARLVADKLSQTLGQPLIVDNRAGAGGTIGSDAVAKSPADGYTLLAASSGPISTIPNVQTVPYDPLKAFAPISLTVIVPYVLVTAPSFPAANVKELIAAVKANPEKYAFSSSGTGATSHLVSELFHSMAGIAPTHVPYKGSAPSLTDVMGGQVSYTFETVA